MKTDWHDKTWTVDEMLAEHPCAEYTRARLEELWAGRERLGLREILDLPIPDRDKVWVGCQQWIPKWIVDRGVRRSVETQVADLRALLGEKS